MSNARTRCDCCGQWTDAVTLEWSVGNRVCPRCWDERVRQGYDTVSAWGLLGAKMKGEVPSRPPFKCFHGEPLGRVDVEASRR